MTIKTPFAIIPTKVLKDKSLSNIELRLICVMSTYVNEDGYCYPSINKLAEDCGCGKLTIIRGIKRLEEAGYVCKSRLQRKDGGNASNLYYINYNPEKAIHTPSITDDTTPSITGDTTLVSPVIPELNIKELNTFNKVKEHIRTQYEKKRKQEESVINMPTYTDEDAEIMAHLEQVLTERMGANAYKALEALEVKKTTKGEFAFIAPSRFAKEFLEDIGFFEVLADIKSEVFGEREIKILKQQQVIGLDLKQQSRKGA